ncbi:MAG: methylated-DNA--[protein]-cysteine S-methyltransferase [Polyangiaceae bacterium]
MTSAHAYTLFETALGRCGIAWSERGVAMLCLPEPSSSATERRMRRRFPEAVGSVASMPTKAAIDAIVALLSGEPRDLLEVELDMRGVPDFQQRVYVAARQILPGRTLTYGEVARRLGVPGAARAVGQALGRNPFAVIVPCHRVLAAGGNVGGFSANGGAATKLRMLAIEGVRLPSRAEPTQLGSAQPGLFDRR